MIDTLDNGYHKLYIKIMIRVGIKDRVNADEDFPDYYKVVTLTKSTPYGDLSPYCLTVDITEDQTTFHDVLLENAWQFSKLYRSVPNSVQRHSRYDKTVVWDHPSETHIASDHHTSDPKELATVEPTDAYWAWRDKGFRTAEPIRYPVGFDHRHECVCSLWYDEEGAGYRSHSYIEARKNIYLPLYLQAVVDQPKFLKLKDMLLAGKNLLILEVDGPHQESLGYYQQKYGVPNDFISQHTVVANKRNMALLLNDPKHPFGHGYCLALALLYAVEVSTA